MGAFRETEISLITSVLQENGNTLSAVPKELHGLDGVTARDMVRLGSRIVNAAEVSFLLSSLNQDYLNGTGWLGEINRVIRFTEEAAAERSLEEGFYALSGYSIVHEHQILPEMPTQVMRIGFGIVNGGERVGSFMVIKNKGKGLPSEQDAFFEIINDSLSLDIQNPDTIEHDYAFFAPLQSLAKSLIATEYLVRQSQRGYLPEALKTI